MTDVPAMIGALADGLLRRLIDRCGRVAPPIRILVLIAPANFCHFVIQVFTLWHNFAIWQSSLLLSALFFSHATDSKCVNTGPITLHLFFVLHVCLRSLTNLEWCTKTLLPQYESFLILIIHYFTLCKFSKGVENLIFTALAQSSCLLWHTDSAVRRTNTDAPYKNYLLILRCRQLSQEQINGTWIFFEKVSRFGSMK